MDAPASPLFAALYDPSDIIEVRCLRQSGGAQSKWFEASQLATTGAPRLLDGASVYFGANPRKSFGEKDKSGVALCRALFVDLDGVDLDAANHRWLDAGLPTPTAVVFSGGGVHLWWKLDEPITDLADFTARQKRLIRLTGGDKAIHDPPRIMRYPGTLNVKRGKMSELIDCKAERSYPLAEFPPDEVEMIPYGGSTLTGVEGLSRATLMFMSAGAPEGERNKRLFAAAADFAGCGLPIDEAYSKLAPLVVGGDFNEQEARLAIQSAYSRPRVPGKKEEITNEWLAANGLSNGNPGSNGEHPEGSIIHPGGVSKTVPADTFTPGLPRIANVNDERVETPEGSVNKSYARFVVDIAGDVYRHNHDWPRLVGGQLFTEQSHNGEWKPRLLRKPDCLFAWMHERAVVRWGSPRGSTFDKITGQIRSCVTRQEFHSHLRETCPKRYVLVSDVPHYPLIEGVHYLPCELPPGNGKALNEFLTHLNPETENDRRLMLAAFLTTLWGGFPGSRPMFCFTAKTKQGSGKTATALSIASIVGGAFSMDPREKWADNAKRMMSSSQWDARVILWDNVKGRFGGENIEAAVTAPTINGWQAYTGTITRYNDVTHFVTLNDPELSTDLSLRSVEIRVGSPKHGVQFVDWARRFVAENRWQLIADGLAMLQGPEVSTVKVNDRFGAWQHAVLARIPEADELSEWIVERRGSLDADAKIADDIAEALQAVLLKQGRTSGEVSSDDLYLAATESGVWKDDNQRGIAENRRRAVRMVAGLLGSHGLRTLTNEVGKQARKRVTDEGGNRRQVNLYDWSPQISTDDLDIPV
jgi:hypothetical protein